MDLMLGWQGVDIRLEKPDFNIGYLPTSHRSCVTPQPCDISLHILKSSAAAMNEMLLETAHLQLFIEVQRPIAYRHRPGPILHRAVASPGPNVWHLKFWWINSEVQFHRPWFRSEQSWIRDVQLQLASLSIFKNGTHMWPTFMFGWGGAKVWISSLRFQILDSGANFAPSTPVTPKKKLKPEI